MLSDNERPTQGRVKFFSLAASKNGNPAEPQGCRFILDGYDAAHPLVTLSISPVALTILFVNSLSA